MSRSPVTTVLSHVPAGILGRFGERFPDLELVVIPEEGPIPESARGEVLLTQAWGSPNFAEVMTRGVEWVHAFGTGVDAFPYEHLGDTPFTCSRGASAIPISEWVIAVTLAAEKRLPEMWISTEAKWEISELGGLHGRTLGIFGFGGIGQAVAQRALAFGMRVIAHRRSEAASPVEGVELTRSLDTLLAESEHLVLAAPVTDETRRSFDRDRFAKLRRGVHLVNVARGELIDQDALRGALDEGIVGLASLDVATPEPLPEGHWLYHHPKVRLSPHISWSMPGALDRLLEPFLDNLARYREGRPLEGHVDPKLGY